MAAFNPKYVLRSCIFLFFICFAVWGCKPAIIPSHSESFLENFHHFCKKEFKGSIVYPAGNDAPFKGQLIKVKVIHISPNEIQLPITIGNKIYRILHLKKDANGVWLQHENKKPDGTQAEISLYGGKAINSDKPFLMVFQADAYTKALLGSERNSSWLLAFSNDKQILTYIAQSDGFLDLQLDFDLTTPVP